MSMKPEQSSGELAGLFIRVGNMFFQVAAAGDSCEESLSDKAIPLYAAPPAQIVSIPDDWQTCEKLSDDSYVDNALRELVEDTTGDNGVRVVQAVMRALRDSGLIRTYPDLSQPVDPQISEYERIMLQAGNSPAVRFDNRYITTRLEVFEDTYEIIAWLERMADECCDPDDKYGLKEAATSLRGMYADLKEFGGALMQIQGESGPEAEK
uniref:hypothetical protein n=1 Tax=Salmonella enterica TaxID=28901 RepID=UPI003A8DF0F7